ncbi:hypothetical protein KY284_023217 [Solanum tuberosum]|nr:hypothetical protein KY284_023217 [Solanum tuberosum]
MEREAKLAEEKPRKGVNESFARIASYGLLMNMIIYLMTYYNMTAATILALWAAFSNGLAIVADSYLGRLPLDPSPLLFESLLIGLLQAVVAVFRKRNTRLPLTDCDDYYHSPLESEILTPSNDFRACVIEDPQRDLNPDGSASNPWSLCSVEQVESLKALIRVLPMWFMIFVAISQFSSVLQAKTMDRHIFPHFEIPAASFSVFMIIALTIWITFYDRVLVPLLSKYTGQPRGLSPVIRMGIGLIVTCMSMALSAITESTRRQRAIEEGHEDDPSALVNMSAMWLVPQYALLGVAEAAHAVGQIEFFYSLLPKSMSSMASAMYTVGTAVSSLVVSILVSGVDWLSSTGGKTSWLSSNINKGHLDYYFWLLTFLSLLNFFYFLVICRLYEPNDGSSRLSHEAEETQCDYRLLPES